MLIFDDKTQYKNLIKNGFKKYPNKRDLMILCNQWINDGVKFSDLKEYIIKFCHKWNSQFNFIKSENLILNVLKLINNPIFEKKEFIFSKNIKIFKNEIETIKKIENKDLQKIGFIIMCLAKWRNSNFIYLNTGSSIKLKDIFLLAGIKKTIKEQELSLHQLNNYGFVEVQLKPLLKYIIPSIETAGEEILNFKINNDMINHLIKLLYPHCEICGLEIIKMSNKQKYCKICSKIILNKNKLKYWKTRTIGK